MGAPVGGREAVRVASRTQPEPAVRRMPRGPNSPKTKTRSAKCSMTYSMRSSSASRSEPGESFQVVVCWKVMPFQWSRARKPSPPMLRPGSSVEVDGEFAQRPASGSRPSSIGRMLAVRMTRSSSSGVSRRGQSPVHSGPGQVGPQSLKAWMTSRTVLLPRQTIRCSSRLPETVSLQALRGTDTTAPKVDCCCHQPRR